jgi:hypothetical protein
VITSTPRIIAYSPQIAVSNVAQLAAGTGCRYLEVTLPHRPELPYIAVAWRRRRPAYLAPGRALLDFRAQPATEPEPQPAKSGDRFEFAVEDGMATIYAVDVDGTRTGVDGFDIVTGPSGDLASTLKAWSRRYGIPLATIYDGFADATD